MDTTEIFIYGASGHGKVILDIFQTQGIPIAGFIDDDISKTEFVGLPVFRYEQVYDVSANIVMGIGINRIRKSIVGKISNPIINAIHPSSVISEHSIIGLGTVIMQMAVVQSGAKIGRNCIINTKASVDHDCIIGDFVHISPGATLCGNVTIGDLTWVGAGTIIIQGITVGKNVTIGAGSVIIKDIPDNVTVLGNPGRIINSKR